jgi:Flp pilus assembly CpaE family ATPase
LPEVVDVAVIKLGYTNSEAVVRRMTGTDSCLLVANHSVPSLEALKTVCDMCALQPNATEPMLVISAFDPARRDLTPEVMYQILGRPVHTIRKDEAVVTAANKGTFLEAIDPDSPALQDIRALTGLILKLRVEPSPTHGGFFKSLWDWLRE